MAVRNDFTGLTDWYLDTANLQIDPAFRNYFLRDPKNIDQRRIEAYRYFIDFYRGRHWEEQGEFNPAFGNRTMINETYNRRTWNLVRNIVKKNVSFLMKNSWTTKLPESIEALDYEDDSNSLISKLGIEPQEDDNGGSFDPSDPLSYDPSSSGDAETEGPADDPIHEDSPATKILKRIEATWQANDRDNFNYALAYTGCITGDAYVRVSYDEDFYAKDIGELHFDVLDSRTVIPFFDPHDRNKMIGCRIQYPIFQVTESGEKEQVTYTEVHTPNNIVYFLNGEVQQIAPNPLGEMMIVHFKNEPLPTDRFGTSDLYDLILPSKEYNEKISDLSEILSYHAAPVTIIKGARVQNLERGARKVWGGIPPEGDVFNLELQAGGAEAAQAYLEVLKQHIHETGNVPEEALGALQNVSNTSGAALQIQYQPLYERTMEKQKCYAVGLRKLNELILKFYEAIGEIELPDKVSPADKYRTIINWGDPLPRDESVMLADIATKLGLGLESKKGALKEMGEENPDAKLEEIKEETLEQAQMDFLTSGLTGFGDPSAGPDGMGGQPGTSGTAPGAENGPKPQVTGALNAAKTNPNVQGQQVSNQAVKNSAQTTQGNQQQTKP